MYLLVILRCEPTQNYYLHFEIHALNRSCSDLYVFVKIKKKFIEQNEEVVFRCEDANYTSHDTVRLAGSASSRCWKVQLSDFGHRKSAGFVSKLIRGAQAAVTLFKVVHCSTRRTLDARFAN